MDVGGGNYAEASSHAASRSQDSLAICCEMLSQSPTSRQEIMATMVTDLLTEQLFVGIYQIKDQTFHRNELVLIKLFRKKAFQDQDTISGQSKRNSRIAHSSAVRALTWAWETRSQAPTLLSSCTLSHFSLFAKIKQFLSSSSDRNGSCSRNKWRIRTRSYRLVQLLSSELENEHGYSYPFLLQIWISACQREQGREKLYRS